MKSIFQLLGKYKSDITIVPIFAIIAIVVTVFLYIFIKKKYVKYILHILAIIVGFVLLFRGYQDILEESGINSIKTAIKILAFGGVGFLFSAVLDLLDSLSGMFRKNKVQKRDKKTNIKPNEVKENEEADEKMTVKVSKKIEENTISQKSEDKKDSLKETRVIKAQKKDK